MASRIDRVDASLSAVDLAGETTPG